MSSLVRYMSESSTHLSHCNRHKAHVYTAYLLGGAYRARAHAHSESISTSCYKAAGLSACHHIAGNDLQIWMGLLQVLQHLYLVGGVPCTGRSYSHAGLSRQPTSSAERRPLAQAQTAELWSVCPQSLCKSTLLLVTQLTCSENGYNASAQLVHVAYMPGMLTRLPGKSAS